MGFQQLGQDKTSSTISDLPCRWRMILIPIPVQLQLQLQFHFINSNIAIISRVETLKPQTSNPEPSKTLSPLPPSLAVKTLHFIPPLPLPLPLPSHALFPSTPGPAPTFRSLSRFRSRSKSPQFSAAASVGIKHGILATHGFDFDLEFCRRSSTGGR